MYDSRYTGGCQRHRHSRCIRRPPLTILPSPTLSWTSVATTHDGTLRTHETFGLDLAEIQGQADGNLVLIADSGEIHLRTDAVSRLSVNSTGNVAIGTSGDTSAEKLYVAGTVAITDDAYRW
jgi:hypothetical protein